MAEIHRNRTFVVRCKGCQRDIPAPVDEGRLGSSLVVNCPVCHAKRQYIVSTELFLGTVSFDVGRALQGR